VQAAECACYVQEVQDTVKGCTTLFNGSILWIKCNFALISVDRTDEFQTLIYQLLSQDTTSNEFNIVAERIDSEFPCVKGWLVWWPCPANASMIFPARRTMSKEVDDATPNTSNPIKHCFSLLHHATRTEQDLIPGIKKLHLHVEGLCEQHSATKGTVYLFIFIFCYHNLSNILST
jgi:hypothetical protein